MANRLLLAGFFLVALVATAQLRAAPRYPVELPLKAQEKGTKKSITLPAKKGYTYEVSEQLTDVAVVKIFNTEGKALDGYYEIAVEDLRTMMAGKQISAGLKAVTASVPTKPKCTNCEVSDPGLEKKADRRPAIERPVLAVDVKLPPTISDASPAKVPAKPEAKPEVKRDPLCATYDKFRAQGVPSAPLKQALLFYSKQQNEKAGPRKVTKSVIGLADYSQNSREKRFYMLDLATGKVVREKVSHGGGMGRAGYPGDPAHKGMLKKCGSVGGQGLQRPGFFKFGDYYYSDHGRGSGWPLLANGKNGVKLVGLSPKVNWNAENDGVVVHEAKYNFDGNKMPMGRTNACLGFVPGRGKPLMKVLNGGGMLYSYAPQCTAQMAPVMEQVKGWKSFCGEDKEPEVVVKVPDEKKPDVKKPVADKKPASVSPSKPAPAKSAAPAKPAATKPTPAKPEVAKPSTKPAAKPAAASKPKPKKPAIEPAVTP